MSGEKTIVSMLQETRVFPPPKELSKNAYVKNMNEYKKLWERSIKDPEGFWADMAANVEWHKKWDKVLEGKFPDGKWYVGGKLNVSYNCLDKQIKAGRKDKVGLLWVGEPGDDRKLTYGQLYEHVTKFANVLKSYGIKKGDRVAIYLPMIPELPMAMLACARIGAVHSIVFGGFSAESLRDRCIDSKPKLLITSDGSYRSGKTIPLKPAADQAIDGLDYVKHVVVVKRTGLQVPMRAGRDVWWDDAMKGQKAECEPEWMDAEDPLFVLYTSGSTGKPKGLLHTTGGYLVFVNISTKYIFDIKENDIYWCTADIGWVTGHSYIVYGPLSNGFTSLMFESVPNYPHPGRFWEVVEKYKVNVFYTAPTAIRAMMRDGDEWPNKFNLSSLRVLGSVGEPINPEAWMWYYNNVGHGKCPIVDTWWQTETGGILITPLPGAHALKPGSASFPFFGVDPVILKEDGSEAAVNEGGYLVIRSTWPAIARTIYGDPDRYVRTYFSKYKGMYLTGDGARKDEDGYFWLMGRIDDVVNVSGHRIGTMEVESAIVAHPKVAEAAIVPMPHPIKGQGLYAYVTLKKGQEPSDALVKELRDHVSKMIGPIAKPDVIQFTDALPKTRSGKIMRRILKVIAEDGTDLGNTTTLADPTVVDRLRSDHDKLVKGGK
jgi:acetyl-CoA synthetase